MRCESPSAVEMLPKIPLEIGWIFIWTIQSEILLTKSMKIHIEMVNTFLLSFSTGENIFINDESFQTDETAKLVWKHFKWHI